MQLESNLLIFVGGLATGSGRGRFLLVLVGFGTVIRSAFRSRQNVAERLIVDRRFVKGLYVANGFVDGDGFCFAEFFDENLPGGESHQAHRHRPKTEIILDFMFIEFLFFSFFPLVFLVASITNRSESRKLEQFFTFFHSKISFTI